MISLALLAPNAPTTASPKTAETSARADNASKADKPRIASRLAASARSAQAQQKEMARKKLYDLIERMKTLKMMIDADPRAALKMATDMAKELRAAVKAYVEAGGRNVSDGDLAMLRQRAKQAGEAADAAHAVEADAGRTAEALAPAGDPDPAALDAAGSDLPEADPPVPFLQARQAVEAYARAQDGAAGAEADVRRIDAVFGQASADNDFFKMSRGLAGAFREAHDKIRYKAFFSLSKPTDKEWKAAAEAQKDLEKQIDSAPTSRAGAPDQPAPAALAA